MAQFSGVGRRIRVEQVPTRLATAFAVYRANWTKGMARMFLQREVIHYESVGR
jgi:hypothetical protein